jgi:trimeric autotransporter adhesin
LTLYLSPRKFVIDAIEVHPEFATYDFAPEISLAGSSTVALAVGGVYVETGVTASDEADGNITGSIQTTGTVNTNVIGTYTLTYSVADTANQTTQETRDVIIEDASIPIITLNGSSVINLITGSVFSDPGFSTNDDIDGDTSSNINVNGSVDTSMAATYNLTYSVSDAAGNAATEVERTVIVTDIDSNGVSEWYHY